MHQLRMPHPTVQRLRDWSSPLRIAALLAVLLLVVVGLTRGFGSADSRATNDGRQILEARLQTIWAEAASDLRGVGAGRVGPVVTENLYEVYDSQTSAARSTWDLYLRTTGRDGWSIANHTVSVGGCVRMRASDGDLRSWSIPCPQSIFDATRTDPDVELDLVDGTEKNGVKQK